MISQKLQSRIVYLYTDKLLSSHQIANRLDISDSAVNYYLKKFNVKKRSISESIISINKTKFGKKPFHVKQKLSLNEERLKVAGVMLYWGEGSKTKSTVKFTNSDPKMIKIFCRFLREVCGIDEPRLKALLHRYPDQDEQALKKFWSSVTKIPVKSFYKTSIQKGKQGTYKRKSKYGTLMLSYSDVRLLRQIMVWIAQYGDSF